MGLFNPNEAETQGQFLEGRNLKITDTGYVIFDGNGMWTNESTCVYWQLTDLDGKLERPVDQYWSMGPPDKFVPSKDGKSVEAKKKLSKTSNAYHLMVSLVNAGVPMEVLDAMEKDSDAVLGMEYRSGVTMIKRKDGPKPLDTIDEILVMPGEAGSDDPEAAAQAIVEGILDKKAGSVALKSLPKMVATAIKAAGFDTDFAKAVRKAAINKKLLGDWFTIEGNNLVA